MLSERRALTLIAEAFGERYVPLTISVLMEEEGELAKEYEQRWKLKKLPDGCKSPSEIKQGKLFDKPGFNMRIRQETTEGKDPVYSMTLKFYEKSDEAEVTITKEMFDKLWPETIADQRMEKTRWRHGDWEIDEIRSPKERAGWIVAEIETAKKDKKIEPPAEWDVEKKFVYK